MLVFFMSCNINSKELNFHKSHEANRANAPFSDVVETHDLMFLTGQIGKDHKTGNLVEGGINAETKQVIENIKAVLQYHNLELDNVVKCTVILKDIKDLNIGSIHKKTNKKSKSQKLNKKLLNFIFFIITPLKSVPPLCSSLLPILFDCRQFCISCSSFLG